MPDHVKSGICLLGAGLMGIEYAKVLQALGANFYTVSRSSATAEKFTAATGLTARSGGVGAIGEPPREAIVTVSIDQLLPATSALLEMGVKRILVEKPAGADAAEIRKLAMLAEKKQAEVYVAYNRRFYASTLAAQKLIAEDGGVTSFQFEFTEWPHLIEPIKDEKVKQEWLLGNSSHVLDTAFFLGGSPKEFRAFRAGSLAWHKEGSRFAGAGITAEGATFSYSANWNAPGRWSVEILTAKRRLIFRPMEKLQVQNMGSVAVAEAAIDDELDKKFKPGIYRQTAAFLKGGKESANLLPLTEHTAHVETYLKIRSGS